MNLQSNQNLLHYLKTLKLCGFNYTSLDLKKYNNDTIKLPNNLKSLDEIIQNCNLCNLSVSNDKMKLDIENKNQQILFLDKYFSSDMLKGDSGKLLSYISDSILNIHLEEIYIATILKCTPKLIKLYTNEMDICKSYLKKELDIIKPKVIVSFGDSLNYVVNEDKTLLQRREKIDYLYGIKVISTFHPNYIVRNPSLKEQFFNDLKKAKSIMELE